MLKPLQAAMYLGNFFVTLSHTDEMSTSDTDHWALSRTPHIESHSLGVPINSSLNAELILVAIAFCNRLEMDRVVTLEFDCGIFETGSYITRIGIHTTISTHIFQTYYLLSCVGTLLALMFTLCQYKHCDLRANQTTDITTHRVRNCFFLKHSSHHKSFKHKLYTLITVQLLWNPSQMSEDNLSNAKDAKLEELSGMKNRDHLKDKI
jgi:hypothetical protein